MLIHSVDAAKRRQLPAWIREGLEKMEKEKQKAMERERLEMLRQQEIEARKQAQDEARAVLNPGKSKFVSINPITLPKRRVWLRGFRNHETTSSFSP